MQLDVPVRHLGKVAAEPLTAAVLASPLAAWREETLRQKRYEQHHETESLILCFCDGWPRLKVTKGPAWDRLYPLAAPVVDQILSQGYMRGGKVVRMMVARLRPGGHIALHTDTHPSFGIGHRIHVPLQTNADVEFLVDGQPAAMRAGFAYEIDNRRKHQVSNGGSEDRIHLIFDYIPPGAIDAGS